MENKVLLNILQLYSSKVMPNTETNYLSLLLVNKHMLFLGPPLSFFVFLQLNFCFTCLSCTFSLCYHFIVKYLWLTTSFIDFCLEVQSTPINLWENHFQRLSAIIQLILNNSSGTDTQKHPQKDFCTVFTWDIFFVGVVLLMLWF